MTTGNPTPQEVLTLSDAYTNALVYGIGVIKIVNTPQGPVMSVVPSEEYLAVADHLKFAVENTMEIKDGECQSPTKT